MIYDTGKLVITVVLLVGLFGIIIFGDAADSPQAWAILGGVVGYVFANGKQLISPFVPSPMMVPNPEKAKVLLRKQLEDLEDFEAPEAEAATLEGS